MESQSTVAEADSTSLFSDLDPLSHVVSPPLPDVVQSSESFPSVSSPSQSPLGPSSMLTVTSLSPSHQTDYLTLQCPSVDYMSVSSPSSDCSGSQYSASALSKSDPIALSPPQSPSSTHPSQLSSEGLPPGIPTAAGAPSTTVLPVSNPAADTFPALSHMELPHFQSLPTNLTNSHLQATPVSLALSQSKCTLSSSVLSTNTTLSPQFSLSSNTPNTESNPNMPVDHNYHLSDTVKSLCQMDDLLINQNWATTESAPSVLPPVSTSSSNPPIQLLSPTVSSHSSPSDISTKSWRYDPLASPDWDRAGPPGNLCAGRVKKDLSTIFTEPLPGIFAAPEEDNLFKVHCLIIGPFDTPYEGGFFHFLVRFGPQYPLHPPRVRLLTTGGDTVRFNPNLYKNGKVCLSILGTWSGPAWSPASNLSSVLLSLQSLLNERPYHNEPGYDKELNLGDSDRYNSIIMHETIRVAVIQQLEGNTTAPPDLLKVMLASFVEYYDHYVEICEKNMHKDGQTMEDPFGERRGRFQYATLLKQLKRLRIKLKAKGIPEVPETSGTTDNDDVSSISESEEGSPVSEGDDE